MKVNVVFGFLGTQKDKGKNEKGWKPTVAVAMQEEFPVGKIVLFHPTIHAQDKTSTAPLLKQVVSEIQSASPKTDVYPIAMDTADPWDFDEVYGKLYEFFSRYEFHPDREEYFVNLATGTHTAQICLFLLVKSRHIPGKLLQMQPPRVGKTENAAGTHKIIDLDLLHHEQLKALEIQEQWEATQFLKAGIPTRNEKYNDLINEIEQVVAPRSAQPLRIRRIQGKIQPAKSISPSVLLIGATGVGKSQLARRIYELKKQRRLLEGDFIEVNCATLKGTHAMSALFGHAEGAYTGANKSRPGYLRAADGGILFLDEIGELGLEEQAMLLRAIESKRFQPLGLDKDVSSDFQLISGTNRDLHCDVLAGKFREDLLARINLWTFHLPNLVDRREDIEPNIDYEMRLFSDIHNMKIEFNSDARKKFLDFALSPVALWKSNFRDLNAAIVRMATLSTGGRITVEIVAREIQRLEKQWQVTSNDTMKTQNDLLEQFFDAEQMAKIDHFDRAQLLDVIQICRISKTLSEAGRRLFQYSRTQKNSTNDASRLQKYLNRFGLSWERIKER